MYTRNDGFDIDTWPRALSYMVLTSFVENILDCGTVQGNWCLIEPDGAEDDIFRLNFENIHDWWLSGSLHQVVHGHDM